MGPSTAKAAVQLSDTTVGGSGGGEGFGSRTIVSNPTADTVVRLVPRYKDNRRGDV